MSTQGLDWLLTRAENLSVLHVGCGEGLLACKFYKHGASRVCGIDNSPSAIIIAVQRCPEVSFMYADVTRWGPKEPYGIILLDRILRHVTDPQATAEKFVQWTTKYLMVRDPQPYLPTMSLAHQHGDMCIYAPNTGISS